MMLNNIMEYFVSQSEISRRKKAFTVLIIGILVGTVLASYIFDLCISWWGVFLIIATVLCVFWLTWWFLVSLSKTKLYINDKYIERINDNDIQRIYFSDIKVIGIKRRVSGGIREIYLWLEDNKKMFFGGFEDNFEEIESNIRKNVSVEVIKEEKEFVDYDHWLFYPFLGVSIGVLGISFFVLLLNLSDSILFIYLFVFSIFLFLLSMYFIFFKPISAMRGDKGVVADYLFGFIMFSGCVFVLWIY